jgi:hypothetical protein
MNAQALQARTAVGLPVPAGDTFSATEVRQQRNHIPLFQAFGRLPRGRRNFRYPHRKLVAHDPGIGKEGLGALKSVKIRAADSRLQNLKQNLVIFGRRLRPLFHGKLAGFFHYQGFHISS